MDINTGKLILDSSSLKKIKDKDTPKISEINIKQKLSNSNQILNDVNDIQQNDIVLKSKLIKINDFLMNYENELSKLQFIDQRLSLLENLVQNNDNNQIPKIIKESIFNEENVLSEFFLDTNNISENINKTREDLNNNLEKLNKEYKTIEVTSQNLISLYSQPGDISIKSLEKYNFQEMVNSLSLSKKRVLDLIS